MKLFIQEIFNIYCFFCKIPALKKEVVIYSEKEFYHSYFEGIVMLLTKKYKKDIVYITSDPNDPILISNNPRIKSLYLNRLLPYYMLFVNCKVFVMTLTDLDNLHLRRSTRPVHYVYLFHALVSTHMMYSEPAFDNYDTLLCPTKYHIEEIRLREKKFKLPKKSLIKAGYYRLERVYNSYKRKKPTRKKQKTILVAPSWGDDNLLKTCGEQMVKKILESGNRVIVRPHPETIRRSPLLIKTLKKSFSKNKLFTLETSTATDDSLINADLLITDLSGVALEYAFGTERPVLFVDVPFKTKNKNYKKLGIEPFEVSIRNKIGLVISPKKINNINQKVNLLIKNRNKYKKKIRKIRSENIFGFGKSSEIGALYIIKLLKKLYD